MAGRVALRRMVVNTRSVSLPRDFENTASPPSLCGNIVEVGFRFLWHFVPAVFVRYWEGGKRYLTGNRLCGELDHKMLRALIGSRCKYIGSLIGWWMALDRMLIHARLAGWCFVLGDLDCARTIMQAAEVFWSWYQEFG